jgi:hypothetical protein
MIAAGSGGLPPKKGERRMHSAPVRTFAEDRINEFRREASIALWLRRMGTAFGASVVLALLAPAAFAMPVESDRDAVGTGTLAQLGNSTNIASGASQGYLAKVGKEVPREPAVPIEGSTPEPWLWAGALVALITGGTLAVWMHRHRRSVATA